MNAALQKIFIVVLNWNGHKDTIECVESLKKLAYPSYEILIVDNGSTDGSEEILRKKFPEVALIQTGENVGFAGGMNVGIRHALKKGVRYMVLLNNDTVVHPEFAGELVKAVEMDRRAGILFSKVYFYDRPGVLWNAGYRGAGFSQWRGLFRPRAHNAPDNGQFGAMEETQRPCGTSMLVTREFCEKVGLLDEAYFSYNEDMEWGIRARKDGFKVVYVPSSKIWHKIQGATGGPGSAIPLYYTVRNFLICLDKYFPKPFPLNIMRYAAIAGISFLSLFTMKIPKIQGAKCIYRGLRDCIRGKGGAMEASAGG